VKISSATFRWGATDKCEKDDFCSEALGSVYTKVAKKTVYCQVTHNSNAVLIIYEQAFPFHQLTRATKAHNTVKQTKFEL
jgi:hypothetical protein